MEKTLQLNLGTTHIYFRFGQSSSDKLPRLRSIRTRIEIVPVSFEGVGSLSSVPKLVFFEQLRGLCGYLEQHVEVLRSKSDHNPPQFMTDEYLFGIQVGDGEVTPESEGHFFMRIMIMVGFDPNTNTRVRFGLEGSISTKDVLVFTQELREMLKQLDEMELP